MKKKFLAMMSMTVVAGMAHADVTLYGVIDIGIANVSNGQNIDGSAPAPLPYVINPKSSNKSITSVTSNGLSQSFLGFKGSENISPDLTAGFQLEGGFEPGSGALADGLKGLQTGTANTTTGNDTSRAGQLFNQRSVVYLSSKSAGTLTVGRQYTVALDDIGKYDPQQGSQAFSPIGYYGSYGGGGFTEDARLDNAVKYNGKFNGIRVDALYQFGGIAGNNTANSGWQGGLGTDFGNLSLDALYAMKHDGLGVSPNNPGLKGTIADVRDYGLFAKYVMGPATLSGGRVRYEYTTPADGGAGYSTIGGYTLAAKSATAASGKKLDLTFGGLRYTFTPEFDLTGAYYLVHQNDFSGTGCSNNSKGSCSGDYKAYSLVADYKLSKRTDVYAGVGGSNVEGGMSNGFVATSNTTTMVGIRHRF